MSTPERFQFPECLHPVAASLHMLDLDPCEMVIELPRATWWTVRCEMDRKYGNFSHQRYDGRGPLPDEFQCMGIRFRARAGT